MHSLAVENKQEADSLLSRWGNWAAANGDYVGYPNMTPYRRLQGQSIGAAGLTDEEGAHIDAIISDLKAFNKEARELAVFHYVHGFELQDLKHTKLKAGRTKAIKLKSEVLTWVCSRLFFGAG